MRRGRERRKDRKGCERCEKQKRGGGELIVRTMGESSVCVALIPYFEWFKQLLSHFNVGNAVLLV